MAANRNLLTVINLLYFVALVYMCCYVVAFPFSAKWKRYMVTGGTGIIVAVNVLICIFWPETVISQIALFTQTIPSFVICWIASRHKDMRFLFVFCALDVIAFELLLLVNGVVSIFHFSNVIAVILYCTLLIAYLLAFHRYGLTLRKVINRIQKKWNRLAFLCSCFICSAIF